MLFIIRFICRLHQNIWKEFIRNAIQSRVTLSQCHLFLFMSLFSILFSFIISLFRTKKEGKERKKSEGEGYSEVMEILRMYGDDGWATEKRVTFITNFDFDFFFFTFFSCLLRCGNPVIKWSVDFDNSVTNKFNLDNNKKVTFI